MFVNKILCTYACILLLLFKKIKKTQHKFIIGALEHSYFSIMLCTVIKLYEITEGCFPYILTCDGSNFVFHHGETNWGKSVFY